MYSFIWRRLPGNTWLKLLQTLAVAAGVVTLLWVVVFPWAEPLLPFDDVQVGTGTENTQEQVPSGDLITSPEPTAS